MSTYLTSKASDIKTKAQALKSTAETQSNSELGNTNQTDLQQNNNHPQTNLTKKAEQLAAKAQGLHTAADGIVQAAKQGSPLQPLNETAQKLKNAAKGTSSGLYQAAETLANKAQQTEAAQTQATAVITAFDNVEQRYEALMDEYKKILNNKEKAVKLTQTDKEKVIEVVKAYYVVKTTYYQMLIVHRIQKKAIAFHGAASQLQSQAQPAEAPESPLGKLQKDANQEMADLVDAAKTLKDEAEKLDKAPDAQIVEKYLAVVEKYNELEVKKEFTDALEAKKVPQVQNVKIKFDALQKSYVNVLRLRVQELSNMAHTLSGAAGTLSQDEQLRQKANLLKEAASNGNEGLKEKATALVSAINGSGDSDGTKAKLVIEQFDAVTDAYETLAGQPSYSAVLAKIKQNPSSPSLPGDEEKVKDVYDAYTNLKTLYNKILNFTKMKKPATNLDNAADTLQKTPNVENARLFKDKYDKFKDVYDSIPPDIKATFQSDFESIKNVVCGVNLDKKYISYFSIFWTLCNL
ncbi:Tpr-related protein family member, putative [Theileria annulata]|uniref:Tpr-related protein family member, putative n=1 Tax=Theileria annulata TaxID=5874 RepID=Q4UEW3_THEAN|nr:Tpr-related protein family member, putative [Theileria annulata]CAI74376.1 Tpr-related protein family member, putative [Theileria annulata]|eukprot:XP_952108.1 Tpr-related protein family member, putative [Theileria annulata]